MHRASPPLASIITIAALGFSGCSDLPPDQPGMFANNGAVAGGNMARAGGTVSAESQAGGFSSGAMVTATVNVIQKYQATEHQRRVAQERARTAVKRIQVQQDRAAAAASKAGKKTAGTPPSGGGGIAMKAKEVDVTRIEPKPRKKLPRYIAVDTPKDERTSPQAARAVMIFDTQTQEIVGNNVYDVRSTPPLGGTARFETFTAEYVGTGG